MSISIGFRIEFYSDEGELAGHATFEDGYRACAVPQEGDRIARWCFTRASKDADLWEVSLWWPGGGAGYERVHHVEHYPVLDSKESEPGVIVVIHMAAPDDTGAPVFVRELRTAGYQMLGASDEGSALARAIKASRGVS